MKEIKLSKYGKNSGKYVTYVDDEDFEYLNQWSWSVVKNKTTYYAVRTVVSSQCERKCIRMHRLVINAQSNKFVDHKDRNGLNNQKSNLRFCNRSQNMSNRTPCGVSKYLGVIIVYDRYGNRYIKARIKSCGVTTYLGTFKTEEDAANAYNIAALKYHKEFANLNIIGSSINS